MVGCSCICVAAAGKKQGEHSWARHLCVNQSSYYSKVNVCVLMCRGKVWQTVISQSAVDSLRRCWQNESSNTHRFFLCDPDGKTEKRKLIKPTHALLRSESGVQFCEFFMTKGQCGHHFQWHRGWWITRTTTHGRMVHTASPPSF